MCVSAVVQGGPKQTSVDTAIAAQYLQLEITGKHIITTSWMLSIVSWLLVLDSGTKRPGT